jgi:iron-sulfur cluster repair protein YtfE (RIC family)
VPEDGPLFKELLWVHDRIRADLETVNQLVADVGDGAPAAEVRERVEALSTDSILWKLRVNCLTYCRFVHSHHGAEDAMLFPAIRDHDAGLNPVVDRLEADHRKVSDLLGEVEDAVKAPLEEGEEARLRLQAGLEELGTHLLEHLAYEEEKVRPVLNSWKSFPFR